MKYNNTEYDGCIVKPELDENLLEHFGVKGMKWRKHLKGKLSLLKTKVNRKLRGMSADQISRGNGKQSFDRHDDGKAKSTSNPQGNRVYNGKLEIDNKGYSRESQQEKGRLKNGYPDDRVNMNYNSGKYIKKLKKK